MNIVQVIRSETKTKSRKTALRRAAETVTYGGLFERVDEAAAGLKEQGVKEFTRTGIFCREGIDYVILNLAVLSLEAVVIPIPEASSREEARRILDEMKVEVLIFEESLYVAEESLFTFPSPFSGRPLAMARFQGEMKEQNEFEALNPAFIRFTSGTTGWSKGVVISHETILARTEAANQTLQITDEDVVLWVLSMSFHFVVTILLFLRRGAAIVLCGHEIPKGLIEGLSAGDATFLYGAPLHYQSMVHSSGILPDRCRRVRMAVSTTAHLESRTAEAFAQKFGFELSTAYGIIELGLPVVNDSRLSGKRASAGTPAPGYECRLSHKDDDGIGIIHIKGPGMFDAYFAPWKTRERITENGWFETGDLGRFDEEGCLYLLGRHQQVINFMGMKIFPREIEEILNRYPAIAESRVYGQAHSSFGQIPAAQIVLKEETFDIDREALRRYCYERLAKYKVPKEFECVPRLKRTLSGKVTVNQ